MKAFWVRFGKEAEAQNLVEYAVIIALIAVGMIPVVVSVRFALRTLYERHVDVIRTEFQTVPQQPGQAPPAPPVPPGEPGPTGTDNSAFDGLATLFRSLEYFLDFLMAAVLLVVVLLYRSTLRSALRLQWPRARSNR